MQSSPDKFDMLKLMMGNTGAAGAGNGDGASGADGLVPMLVRTLVAQKELYVQLLSLAKQQSQYVATGESESLMTVLAARGRLIDQVSPLDKQLQPYKGRWQEVLDGLGARDRMTVAGMLKEVQQLLGDILRRMKRIRNRSRGRKPRWAWKSAGR